MRKKLIDAGVRNLKQFGYPKVDAENILVDPIYAAFFLSMLEENMGMDKKIDREIELLMAEIKGALK